MSSILFFCVSFFASIAGAICGIGGGVIIKPVLDMLGLASVATISFLSGCTVLSMSCYTVGKNIAAGDNRVDFRTGTPLAIGAAVGGVVGKQLFSTIAGMFPNPNTVGVYSRSAWPLSPLALLCTPCSRRASRASILPTWHSALSLAWCWG